MLYDFYWARIFMLLLRIIISFVKEFQSEEFEQKLIWICIVSMKFLYFSNSKIKTKQTIRNNCKNVRIFIFKILNSLNLQINWIVALKLEPIYLSKYIYYTVELYCSVCSFLQIYCYVSMFVWIRGWKNYFLTNMEFI